MAKTAKILRNVSILTGVLVVTGWSSYTLGAETKPDSLTALQEKGYQVIAKTTATGEFVGCEFNQPVPLKNGMVFVCLSDQRGRAYQPDVIVLRDDNGDVRVLIDGEEYRGTLERG
ncbi:MAG TPA: hypothetical protein VKA19_14785 [Alphaproteobacteria bacterium]|nr:hypothetical protein [Alphaproteobacteria bacterium]